MSVKEILEFDFLSIGQFHLSLLHIILAILVYLLTRAALVIVYRIVNQYFSRNHIDSGRQYATFQFVKYIVYTLGVLIALQTIGLNISVIWGGAAALLVGIGLGLQQTFNDLISGIILLIEGSVEVGDIIEVDGNIGRVESINIRTSKVETLDRIDLLIPNSKLVGDKAINWSHTKTPKRFVITVGVGYGSDIELVRKILEGIAHAQESVLSIPVPEVQFRDFGDSSLDFALLFYSYNYKRIEFVKSEMRFKIIEAFREHKINIPFPQREIKVVEGKL